MAGMGRPGPLPLCPVLTPAAVPRLGGRLGDHDRRGSPELRRCRGDMPGRYRVDRKSTRLNSSHGYISYAVFCLKKNSDRCCWIISSGAKAASISSLSRSTSDFFFLSEPAPTSISILPSPPLLRP